MNPKQLQKMMQQAQKMQKEVQDKQSEIESQTFTAAGGGNAVVVEMYGNKKVKNIEISQEIMDEKDPELLTDLLIAAINSANEQIDQKMESEMGQFTQGLPF